MASRVPLRRNENFFQQDGGAASAERKVQRAFQRCAESGVLNLSEQKLSGDLPASVCGFQEAAWTENWWEQYPVTKIDISHNLIERIPPEIANLCECSAFVALSNRLTSLPEEIFTALPLKQLNVKQNLLEVLPGLAVAKAEQLVELVVAENRLRCLPDEVMALENLEVLDASSNSIRSLPEQGWACRRLRRLDISHNALGPSLPRVLRDCCDCALREISVAGNALRDVGNLFNVPEGHGWRSCLVLLDLSNNQLGPGLELAPMRSLDTLNIASNRLSSLELGDGPFPQLGNVLAGSNLLENFPHGLLPSSAPRLATIDLSNNSLTSLPAELGLNQALKRVALEGNTLRSIRPDLLRGGAEKLKAYLRSRLQGVEGEEVKSLSAQDNPEELAESLSVDLRTAAASGELALDGRGLPALPPLPSGLRILRLSANSLSSASLHKALSRGNSDALGEAVRILDLSRNVCGTDGCDWAFIPWLLRSMPMLQDLNLSFNQLTVLGPPCSWDLLQESLTRVDLTGNGLLEFPVQLLTSCPALNELRLRQNQLTTLEILALAEGSSISTLDLEENRLAAVPPWLPTALPRLKTFLLSNNDIGPTLPPQLGFWESMQSISLLGNPLRGIRQSMIAAGWSGIAPYLRDRLPADAPAVIEVPRNVTRGCTSASGHQGGASSYSSGRSTVPAIPRRSDVELGRSEERRPPAPASQRETTDGYGKVSASVASPPADLVERHERLRTEIALLEEELTAPGLSRARQSSVTHSLRMKRAEHIKVDREIKRFSERASCPESSR